MPIRLPIEHKKIVNTGIQVYGVYRWYRPTFIPLQIIFPKCAQNVITIFVQIITSSLFVETSFGIVTRTGFC